MDQISKIIQYLIKETGVSALELPAYIKTAKTSQATDYTTYLAKEAVRIAEEELGIPHTQLLAKWGTYIINIENNTAKDSQVISEEMLDYLSTWDTGDLVITTEGLGTAFPGSYVPYGGDKDSWLNVDLDEFNTFWLDGASQEFQTAFKQSEEVVLVADLTKPRKVPGIARSGVASFFKEEYQVGLQDEVDVVLARALNLASVHSGVQVGVVLVGPSDFWVQGTRSKLQELFLDNFLLDKGSSYYTDARKVHTNNLRDSDVLVMAFKFGTAGTKAIRLDSDDSSQRHFFYCKGVSNLRYLEEVLPASDSSTYFIEADGLLSDKKLPGAYTEALAYYTKNGISSLENFPRQGAKNYPLLAETLPFLALENTLGTALSTDIRYPYVPLVLDGLSGYENLVADCIPNLVYGKSSNLKSWGVKRTLEGVGALSNKVSSDNDIFQRYLPKMSLTAKVLWDFASDISEDEGMPFWDYRDKVYSGEVEDEDFKEEYERIIKSNLEYIVSNYEYLWSKV